MSQVVYQFVVAFFGTMAFAVLFHVPAREFWCCGLTGGAGWAVYTWMMLAQDSTVLASLAAVLPLTALARLFSTRRKAPITLFLLSGIFPLVPGAGLYYTAYHFIMGQDAAAAARGAETLKCAGAIALGMVLVLSLPGAMFRPVFKRDESNR